MRDFLEATRGAPEHPGLRKAMGFWTGAPGLALDLGCGAGRDSFALLRAGWSVIAMDRDPRALEILREQVTSKESAALRTICCSFEDSGPLPPADLINASFSLPFCRPDAFEDLWMRIAYSLRKDGLFCGHFFGPRDAWADRGLTIHSREQVVRQMEGWALLELNEYEYDGKTAVGHGKHWHLFEVIARRS
jgi:SAM-dependent methyltransferase